MGPPHEGPAPGARLGSGVRGASGTLPLQPREGPSFAGHPGHPGATQAGPTSCSSRGRCPSPGSGGGASPRRTALHCLAGALGTRGPATPETCPLLSRFRPARRPEPSGSQPIPPPVLLGGCRQPGSRGVSPAAPPRETTGGAVPQPAGAPVWLEETRAGRLAWRPRGSVPGRAPAFPALGAWPQLSRLIDFGLFSVARLWYSGGGPPTKPPGSPAGAETSQRLPAGAVCPWTWHGIPSVLVTARSGNGSASSPGQLDRNPCSRPGDPAPPP